MGTQNCGREEEKAREKGDPPNFWPFRAADSSRQGTGKEKGAFNLQHGARKDGRYRHVRQKVSCIDYDLL